MIAPIRAIQAGSCKMSTLTIRIPEGKHEGLRNLAKATGVSVNCLIDELATIALTGYDSETQFRTMAARGSK
jgi:predicted HicB family RNase H-like nuclease